MQVRKARHDDLDAWIKLRHALWPGHEIEALAAGAKVILESDDEVCFVVTDELSKVVGFIEGAVHPGPRGPYGHVEGWYVIPEFRKRGYGKGLMAQFEQWCLHRAICLLTSDTTASYPTSPAAHARCGFREIHQFRIFMREVQQPRAD